MKKLSETLKELGIEFEFPIEIRDSNEYMTYYDASTGFWYKKEYDADGNMTYHENSYGTKNTMKKLSEANCNNRPECKHCNHSPVCKDELKQNLEGECPYYE